MPDKSKSNLADIKMLIMDVDGVLSDGSIIINADGTESKKFNVHDGHGLRMWHRAGLTSAVISGRDTNATAIRAEQLGIGYVLQGCKKKVPAFESLLEEAGLVAEQTAYVGDDLMDLPLVKRAGCGVAVADAVDELKQAADYVTSRDGGDGAVREVIEYILKNTNRWNELMERYLV